MNEHRRTISRGFTLIEIMLVIIILAISAAIVVPMVGNRDDISLSAAARKIVADLQFAQSYAIATRQSAYIRFAADQYSICTQSGGVLTEITHPVEKDPFTVLFGAGSNTALQRVSLAVPSIAGETVLGFDALGTPFAFDEAGPTRTDLTAAATLTLSSGTMTQQIRIEPYTGELTVP